MTALSADFPMDPGYEVVHRCKVQVAAGAKFYKGATVVIDTKVSSASKGYALPGGTGTTVSGTTDSTGQLHRGRAREAIDNTGGANGAVLVEVDLVKPVYVLHRVNSASNPCAASDRGSACYSEDDITVGNVSTGRTSAGRVWDVDTTAGTVAVEIV